MKKIILAPWTLFLTCCFLISLTSCKSGGGRVISSQDSISIYKSQLALQEKIYDDMKLSKAVLEKLFLSTQQGGTPNDVKQLHFVWIEPAYNEFGLAAYGANENGQQITEQVSLEYNKTKYVTNIAELDRVKMVLRRGELKYLLSAPTGRGQNQPIDVYEDIVFSPQLRPYPTTANTMFFSVKAAASWSFDKVVASATGYLNPSPPYNSICGAICDND